MKPELRPQTEWGWSIAADLFLVGTGAGAYAWGVTADIAGRAPTIAKVGVLLGFPCVLLATLILLSHLGVASRAPLAIRRPGTSWISRGTFVLGAFMALGLVHIGAWIWPFHGLETRDAARVLLGSVNLIFALFAMVYTGMLLGASKPISLWSTALVPALFLVSALATGAMAIVLAGALFAELDIPKLAVHADQAAKVAAATVVLVLAEILAILFYLQATHRTTEARASAMLMLNGPFAGHFWIGVVILGLAAPLLLGLSAARFVLSGYPGQPPMAPLLVWSVCGLVGGLFLRYVILASGVRAPLRAGGIEYTIPAPPARAR